MKPAFALLCIAAGLCAGFGGLVGVPYTNWVRVVAVGVAAGVCTAHGLMVLAGWADD